MCAHSKATISDVIVITIIFIILAISMRNDQTIIDNVMGDKF